MSKVREKRELDYYSLVNGYDDLEDFDEEELYVVDEENEGNIPLENDADDIYGYQEFEEPEVEPLLLNPALREIGWMCGDPMPDYAHVVFAAVR